MYASGKVTLFPPGTGLLLAMAVFSLTGMFPAWGGEAASRRAKERVPGALCSWERQGKGSPADPGSHRLPGKQLYYLGPLCQPIWPRLNFGNFSVWSSSPSPALPLLMWFCFLALPFPPDSPNYWSNNSHHRESLHKIVHFNFILGDYSVCC